MKLVTMGDGSGDAPRGRRLLHAPGEDAVRAWQVEWSGPQLEVSEGAAGRLAVVSSETCASAEAARERAAALVRELESEGWLEVWRETHEGGIVDQWSIAVPDADPGEAGRRLVEAMVALDGRDAEPAEPEPPSDLSEAVRAGDADLARAFLDKGADPDERMGTPLNWAAGRGDLALIDLLLARGASVDGPERSFTKPLGEAIRWGQDAAAERLIEAGANVSEPSGLFVQAVLYGRLSLARRFHELGADVDYCPDPELTYTALEFALARGDHAMVSWLVSLGAGHRPNPSPEEAESEDRQRALLEAIEDGDESNVRELLAAGASAAPAKFYDDHPLAVAAEGGDAGIVRLLLEHGADATRYFDTPPMLAAVEGGSLEVMKLVHEAGAPIDQPDEDGYTALMSAASRGELEIVRYLVEHGADVNAWSQGQNALADAARNGRTEVYEFLLPLAGEETRELAAGEIDGGLERAERERQLHPRLEDLVDALLEGDVARVGALLDEVPSDAVDEDGVAPILYPARLGRADLLERLIAWGADVDHRPPEGGDSPLSAAVTGGHVECTRLLLEAGANVDLPNDRGRTPLLELCERGGSLECLKLLLQHGADPNHRDEEGETALMLGCGGEAGDFGELARVLKEAGADLDARDADGNTALVRATFSGASKDYPGFLQESAAASARALEALGASRDGMERVELLHACRKGDAARVRAMLEAGTDPRAGVLWERSLSSAAKGGHLGVVELLLGAGFETGEVTEALWDAVEVGHVETVEALLAAGADVHALGGNQDTPLFRAAEKGHLAVVRALLAAGADPDTEDCYGRSAATVARGLEANEIRETLTAAAKSG